MTTALRPVRLWAVRRPSKGVAATFRSPRGGEGQAPVSANTARTLPVSKACPQKPQRISAKPSARRAPEARFAPYMPRSSGRGIESLPDDTTAHPSASKSTGPLSAPLILRLSKEDLPQSAYHPRMHDSPSDDRHVEPARDVRSQPQARGPQPNPLLRGGGAGVVLRYTGSCA